MIIRKLTASFGKFQGDSLELQPGLNVIEAGNESGKSTWCAFLCAMLYGVDSSAREKGGVLPAKVKYAPWSGAPMEGTMDLTWQGKDITLTRKTAVKTAPMRDFTATYTGTNVPVAELTGNDAGQILTGVPKEVFDRSAFIRQGAIPVTGSPELEKRISALVFSGDEDTSYSGAEETLRGWLRKRRKAMEGLDAQMEALRTGQSAGADLMREREQVAQRLELAEQTVQQFQAETTELRKQQRRDALQRMSEDKNRLTVVKATYDETKMAEQTAREQLSDSPFSGVSLTEARRRGEIDYDSARRMEKESSPKLRPDVSLLGLLCVIGIVLGIFWKQPAAFVGIACGVLAVALGIIHQKGANQSRQKLGNLLAYYGVRSSRELAQLIAEYEERYLIWQEAAEALADAKEALETEYARRDGREERILGALDFETGVNAAASAGRRLKQAQELVQEYRQRLANLDGRLTNDTTVIDGQARLEGLRKEKEKLETQYEAILLALRTLREADEEIQRVFSPKLSAKASEIMGYFTGGRYDAVVLDRNFTAEARLAGDTVPRRSGYLSSGASDLLYLAVRLAVCELVLPAEDCPIILDDSLANIDADRRGRVMDYLAVLAKQRQVIVFSCNEL